MQQRFNSQYDQVDIVFIVYKKLLTGQAHSKHGPRLKLLVLVSIDLFSEVIQV